MRKRQRAHPRAPLCLPASAVATAKSRLRRVAKAGHRRIVEALRALAEKKRSVRVVAKRKMASLRPHHAGALRTETAHRVVARAVEVVTPEVAMRGVATQGAVQDSAIQAQARPGAHRAAVAAMAATHLPPVARATVAVAAVTTATAAVVDPATQAVVADTTGAAQVVVKAVAMAAATKAVAQALVRRVRAGVIDVSRRLTDAVVVAQAAATLAAQAVATEIAVAVAGSQATDVRHLRAVTSALVAARAIATALPASQAASRAAARAQAAALRHLARVGAWANRFASTLGKFPASLKRVYKPEGCAAKAA